MHISYMHMSFIEKMNQANDPNFKVNIRKIESLNKKYQAIEFISFYSFRFTLILHSNESIVSIYYLYCVYTVQTQEELYFRNKVDDVHD